MWFNNALIYQYEINSSASSKTSLHELLDEYHQKPCPPHARFIHGWLPVIQNVLAHEVQGASLVCLGKEERLLPRGVINQLLAEQIEALETQRGYPVKRAEKAQLAEELEFQLLPKAFCLQKRQFALLDDANQRLIINTTSANQAAPLIALLRKSIPGLSIEPMPMEKNHIARFTSWITNPETLPSGFELASDCVLIDQNDEKKKFQCKGYELPADEISALIKQGLAVAELSLIWQERIAFTLTHDFVFKRVKCLDYLGEAFHDAQQLEDELAQQDAELTLLVGEWRHLLQDIMSHL